MSRSPKKILITYTVILLISLALVGLFHYQVLQRLNIDPGLVLLLRAYLVNAVAAIFILVAIYLLRKRMFSQIGFLFLAGSMLKFLLFFLFFNPHYKADGLVSRPEFIGFFIPYCLSLIMETFAVSRLLKGNPDSDS